MLQLEVDSLPLARQRLDAVIARHQGQRPTAPEEEGSGVLIRLPAAELSAFVEEAATLGKAVHRSEAAIDASNALRELTVRQRRLEVSIKRYEALAELAKTVPEGIRVEKNLAPLRAELDQNLGEFDSLNEQVASASCQVLLFVPTTAERDPEPDFYGTVQLSHLLDARGDATTGLLGVGLSLRALEYFSVDLDVYRRTTALGGRDGLDGVLLTVGAAGYSDRFGGGTRRFFNPRLGLRAGVSVLSGRVDLALGGCVTLELVKTRAWSVGLQVSAVALLGNRDGPHAGIQSGLFAGFGY